MEKTVELPKKWWVLTFLALAVSLIVIDGTVVNVSLPVIIRDFKLEYTQAEWIITLYSLVFSALLLTTGRIADHFGRKKILLTGIFIFVIGSVIASFSKDIGTMLIARVVQGIGGAIVLPTTLSSVNSLFFGKDRIVAFAIWGSVISGMAALGPLIGGFITTYATWQWIFLVNLPIGLIIFFGTYKVVPETFGKKIEGRFDSIGVLFSILGLGLIVFSLIEGRTYGWIKSKDNHPEFLGISLILYTIILGVVFFVLFLIWEQKHSKQGKSHILDIQLFHYRSFSLGNAVACIVAIGEAGLLFLLPLYFQNILMFTPMKSGILLAFMGIASFVSGGLASVLVNKTSPKTVVSLGLLLESIGFISFFLFVSPTVSDSLLIVCLIFYGLGLGLASAQLTSIVLSEVPSLESGQGSSVQSTTRQLGSALGVAIIGTIFIVFLQTDMNNGLKDVAINNQLKPAVEEMVIDSAGSAVATIKKTDANKLGIDKSQKIQLIKKLDQAFSKSVSKTIGIAALFMIVSLLMTFGFKRKVVKEQQSEVNATD